MLTGRRQKEGLQLVDWGGSKLLLLGLVIIQNAVQSAIDQIAKLYNLSHRFSLQELMMLLIHSFFVVAFPNEQVGMLALADDHSVEQILMTLARQRASQGYAQFN